MPTKTGAAPMTGVWRGDVDECVECNGETCTVSPVLCSSLLDPTGPPTSGTTMDGAATCWELVAPVPAQLLLQLVARLASLSTASPPVSPGVCLP